MKTVEMVWCAHKSRTNKIQNKYFARKITINSLCSYSPRLIEKAPYRNIVCASSICVPTPCVYDRIVSNGHM